MSANLDVVMPIIIISVIIIVIILGVYFNKKNTVLRKLSKFKHKRITQFRTNELTKITGNVLPVKDPFVAPYSQRKCVAYIFEIEQKVQSGKSSHWKTLVKEKDIQAFFIEQNNESVMVKPSKKNKDYMIYMVEDEKVSSGTFNNPTAKFEKILNRYDIKHEDWFGFNKTLRYTERILEIGETITVGGIAKWKVLNEEIEGYRFSKIASLESGNKYKIIITDLPKAITPLNRGL